MNAEAPDSPPPDLSIVVLNWNTRDLVLACLKSAGAQVGSPRYEWIVVDNASSDGSVASVREQFPEVTVVARDRNDGFSAGCNAGLRMARGRHLLLLNSDTEIRESALDQMIDFLDQHNDVGAVGPRLLNPDGTVQASCRTFPGFQTALFHRKSLLTRLFPGNRYSRAYLMTDMDRSGPTDVDWVIGAALAVRRAVLDKVGLLDEKFFMYAEDVDWCWRIRQAGWRVVYLPSAVVMHHYEKSAGKAPYRTNYARHRSMWRFYHKHYSRGIALLDAATFAGILARFLVTTVRLFLRRGWPRLTSGSRSRS